MSFRQTLLFYYLKPEYSQQLAVLVEATQGKYASFK